MGVAGTCHQGALSLPRILGREEAGSRSQASPGSGQALRVQAERAADGAPGSFPSVKPSPLSNPGTLGSPEVADPRRVPSQVPAKLSLPRLSALWACPNAPGAGPL